MQRRTAVAAIGAIAASIGQGSRAEPTGSPLQRPAAAALHRQRLVLLAAARAGQRWVVAGERGVVLWSDDAAQTWQQARVPVSVTLTSLRFVDRHRGWAVGHAGVVLATADGGQTWTLQLDGIAAARLVRSAAQAEGNAAALAEAERLVTDGADKPLLDLHFFDTDRGFVVGAYNLAFGTEDGGRSWSAWTTRLPNPKGLHLYAARAAGDTVLLAGEQGLVLLSRDGGRSFRRLATPYAGTWFTAELPGPDELLVAGLRGNAWYSGDGGATWQAWSAAGGASWTASAIDDQGGLWLGNQAGQVVRRQGDSLVPRPGPPLPPISALLPIGDARLLASTMSGVFVLGS